MKSDSSGQGQLLVSPTLPSFAGELDGGFSGGEEAQTTPGITSCCGHTGEVDGQLCTGRGEGKMIFMCAIGFVIDGEEETDHSFETMIASRSPNGRY